MLVEKNEKIDENHHNQKIIIINITFHFRNILLLKNMFFKKVPKN